MTSTDPHIRQTRLREVGEEGQARLSRAEACVTGSGDPAIQVSYLKRSGVRRVVLDPDGLAEPFPHAPTFHSDAARHVAAEAWRALSFIRRNLGLSQ